MIQVHLFEDRMYIESYLTEMAPRVDEGILSPEQNKRYLVTFVGHNVASGPEGMRETHISCDVEEFTP